MQARILIVDDEESLVYFVREALALQFPDVAVDAAYSGEEGLSCLAAQPYDVIISDYRMPGFDGLELIQGVHYLDPATRIILITGYGSEELLRSAPALGAQRYLAKPFEMEDLLSAVGDLLAARGRLEREK